MAQLKQQCDQLERNSKWSEAVAVAEKILALAKEKQGEQHAETVEAMHTLARMLNNNEAGPRAEQVWQKTLALEETLFGRESPQAARSLRMLGNVTAFRGEYEKAEVLLQRALRNLELAPPAYNLELGNVLRSLGWLYYSDLGDLNKAESYLLRAVETLERSSDAAAEEHLAWPLSILGNLYFSLGDSAKAEPLFTRALRLCEKTFGPRHAATAIAIRNLAMVYSWRGDFAQAERLFRKCLEIEEEVFDSSERYKMFHTLKGFGEMYLYSGDVARAEPLLLRALSVAEGNAFVAHEYVPSVLSNLGQLKERQHDYDKAADFFQQAYHIHKQDLGRSHPRTLASLRQLARVRLEQGRPDDVLSLADQIQDGEEKYLANGLSFTSERQRLIFVRGWLLSDRYDLWATLGAARALARAIVRTKGIVLDSLLEDRLVAEASANSEVRQLAGQLATAKKRLGQLNAAPMYKVPNSGSRALKTNEIQAVSGQVETLEAALARHVTGVGGARRALATRLEAVQAAIPKDAALLEMIRYNHYQGKGESQPSYGALIFLEAGELLWVRLGPAAPIDKNIKLYQPPCCIKN